jgi:hypothetical protein
MMCGNALTNFDDIEEEATYICGYKKTVLECVYKQDGYASGIPIRKACCVIVCPDYKLWRKND